MNGRDIIIYGLIRFVIVIGMVAGLLYTGAPDLHDALIQLVLSWAT